MRYSHILTRPRIHLLLLLLLITCWLALPQSLSHWVEPGGRAATFYTVTDTNDSGPGTLRQAILDANASAQASVIVFNISPASGVIKITVAAPLPPVSVPVVIDGWSQPGNFGGLGPHIELNGSNAGPNADGLTLAGGNSTLNGLIISRFDGAGLKLQAKGHNEVRYNYFGRDATSTTPQGNGVGLSIEADSPDNDIVLNSISGNDGDGVHVKSNNNVLQQNRIGTAYIPTDPRGNKNHGIVIINAANNVIGANPPAIFGNIIAGNGGDGLRLEGAGTTGNKIWANQIGDVYDSAGKPYGNGGSGISVADSASNNFIGPLPGDFGGQLINFINNNGVAGIRIEHGSYNFIHTALVDHNPLGVWIENGSNNIVESGSINNNSKVGMRIQNGSNNLIRYSEFKHNGVGVIVENGSDNSLLTNFIDHNSGAGVQVGDGAKNCAILGNFIDSNDGPGIDLGPEGVTPNDAGDADAGANNLQNFPLLNSAISSLGTRVTGTLNSTPETTFQLEIFSVNACDPSGHGEGLFAGRTSATTGSDGNASFELMVYGGGPGQFFTATATDPAGNTSEFSPCQAAVGVGYFTFESRNFNINENAGSALITVKRNNGTHGTVAVDYAMSDGTATAGSDYTATGGTLVFADGEASKTFSIPLLDDSVIEGLETVSLSLSNPTGGAAIDPANDNNIATLTIMDEPTEPGTNPIDNAEFFVRQHYRDFLDREPDPEGLAYWTNTITPCGNDADCNHYARLSTSTAFFVEQEFQQTGYFIYRIYRAGLGRRLTNAEFKAERGKVVGGPHLESAKQSFADEFTQRADFKARYPDGLTHEQFVNKLFDTADLKPYLPERQRYISALDGGATRSQVLRNIVEEAAFVQREYNRAFVLMQYFGYLQRDPEPAGYDFWLDVLDNRTPGNYYGMVCAFITSTEYQRRFSTVLTHSNRECQP
jgi:hypothetical protein